MSDKQSHKGTPYDDTFRTLLNDCTDLIIPMVNEVFGEHYTGDEKVVFHKNEHFLDRKDGGKKRITDTVFDIVSEETKHYHLECESTPDDYSILVRIFEYGAQVALDENSEIIGSQIHVSFPHAAVLMLRNGKISEKDLKIVIHTPGGDVSYTVPVMRVSDYTIDDIFDRKLLFLIPYYIFNYEDDFIAIEESSERLEKLSAVYQDIAGRLEALTVSHEISAFERNSIVKMTNTVLMNLAVKYGHIKKEVGEIMSGEVLEYEAKTIRNEGIELGREEGEEKLAVLANRLILDGRSEDLQRAFQDRDFRKELFKEYELD